MTNEDLSGTKIAILVDDGFEQAELAETRKALDQAGAETRVVSPKDQWVRGAGLTRAQYVGKRTRVIEREGRNND